MATNQSQPEFWAIQLHGEYGPFKVLIEHSGAESRLIDAVSSPPSNREIRILTLPRYLQNNVRQSQRVILYGAAHQPLVSFDDLSKLQM